MNPVTLKELRQLTRSRTIAGAICGFFLVLLGAAALVIAANTDSKGVLSSGTGRDVFDWLAALFAPIVAFVIPGNLFARLVSEPYLGRPYRLSGTVVVGKRLGHTIGFPTANVQVEQYKFLPKVGVYVASARLSDGRIYRSVVNIGTQPTTPGSHNLAVEAYLLDFDEDIYGQHLVLDLLAFLRPEKKFASIEDLVRHIGMDADTAKNYNGNHWAE